MKPLVCGSVLLHPPMRLGCFSRSSEMLPSNIFYWELHDTEQEAVIHIKTSLLVLQSLSVRHNYQPRAQTVPLHLHCNPRFNLKHLKSLGFFCVYFFKCWIMHSKAMASAWSIVNMCKINFVLCQQYLMTVDQSALKCFSSRKSWPWTFVFPISLVYFIKRIYPGKLIKNKILFTM